MIIGHKKQWEFLKNKVRKNQLSHAYLFVGPENIGKKHLAIELVKLINCKDKQAIEKGAHCEKCFSCLAIEKESFPDFKIISKSEDKKELDISLVRAAQNFLNYKSYYGSFKSVLVDGAEKMSPEAQNCFLKTLEEPKGKTVLFMISSKPDMLLGTVTSRCQRIKFFKPQDLPESKEKIERDQKIFNNLSKVLGTSLAEKFKYIKSIDFTKQNPLEILDIILRHLRYTMILKTGNKASLEDEKLFGNSNVFKDYSITKIKKNIKLLEDINNKLISTNVNPKLALEILLMEV